MGEHHHNDVVEPDFLNPHKHEQYDLNSKIMLTAIVSLSLVVLLVTILHLYARCLHRRQTRRRTALRQISSAMIIPEQPKTGLDPAIIATLPIFPFKHIQESNETKHTECTICLSQFENDEIARVLPNCKHTFHVECIDMWLGSNSTCPICRTQAEPEVVAQPIVATQPSAPPGDLVNSNLTNVEGSSTSENVNQNHGKISSGSRFSSFRKILTRERSSMRIQNCEEAGLDLERQ